MEQKDIEKLKKLSVKVIKSLHGTALLGLRKHEHLRLIGTAIDIRRADREEGAEEKAIKDLEDFVDKHEVLKAEKAEFKALVQFLKATRHIYKATFNPLVLILLEIENLNHFLEDVLRSRKLSPELKKLIADGIRDAVKEWHDVLRDIHNDANGVFAAAKDRKTVALALTAALHTSGHSIMRRRQEKNLIKDAYKDAVRSEDVEEHLEKLKVKSREQAIAEIKRLDELLMKSEDEYRKAEKLLFVEWKEIDKYLGDLQDKIADAVAKHELPNTDLKQIADIHGFIIEKIIEPFLHSIEKGVNQLSDKVDELDSVEEKLRKAA
jgi:hypothetical protein